MSWTEIITVVGGSGLYLVEASYLPQIHRLYKLKEADEFSFLFPGLNIVGRLFGLALSITQHQPAFGWFFFIGILLRSVLLGQVIYYRTKKKKQQQLAPEIAGETVDSAVGARI
ncbi:MAG TPA: PQ-loop repeat-containing protein [Fimbriimonadaceae bacterium]|jgi:uncharacterized protein with PQ loop repeat